MMTISWFIVIVSICVYSMIAKPLPTDNGPLSVCQVVPLPQGLIMNDVINLVYTMKSSCQLCYKEIELLKELRRALSEIGVAMEVIIGVNRVSHRLSGLDPQFRVDTGRVWEALGRQNGHFYVIDRCGRQAFEVVRLGPDLQFLFVRGAILTAQYTHVCGLCPQDYHPYTADDGLRIYPPEKEMKSSRDQDDTSSRLVMTHPHKHQGDSRVHSLVEMDMANPHYHSHLSSEDHLITGKEETEDEETTTESDFSTTPAESNAVDKTNTSSINQRRETTAFQQETQPTPQTETEKKIGDGKPERSAESSQNLYNITSTTSSIIEEIQNEDVNVTIQEPKESMNIRVESVTEPQDYTKNPSTQSDSVTLSDRDVADFEEETDSMEYTEDYLSPDLFSVKSDNLTSEEMEEKVVLMRHYEKILQWIDK